MSIFFSLVSDVLVLLFILSLAALSLGSVQTATIDDTNGDSKTGAQPITNENSNCNGCTVHANAANAFDNTWHDSSQLNGAGPVSVTLSFTGTGIEVFCILAATVTTDLAFTLDGSPQKPFSLTPGSTPDYIYGESVFSVAGLTQSAHQLTVATNNPSGSLLLFDYAQYSFEVPDTSPPPPPPTTSTDVVTQISTKQVTTQITTTDVHTTAQTSIDSGTSTSSSNTGPNISAPNHTGSPSTTPPMSLPNMPASSKGSSSATLTDSSISPPSSSSSSLSSLAPAISSSKKSNYIPVLLGILIPAILIVVLVVLFFRRRRARRANIPDTVSHNSFSAAPLFASQAPSVYISNSSRPDSGSHRTVMGLGSDNGDMEWDMERGLWGSESGGNSTASGGDIQMRENHNFVASSSASTIQHDPSRSALPPSASTYTFDNSPPPRYSLQRPLPTIPSVLDLPHV